MVMWMQIWHQARRRAPHLRKWHLLWFFPPNSELEDSPLELLLFVLHDELFGTCLLPFQHNPRVVRGVGFLRVSCGGGDFIFWREDVKHWRNNKWPNTTTILMNCYCTWLMRSFLRYQIIFSLIANGFLIDINWFCHWYQLVFLLRRTGFLIDTNWSSHWH